MDRGGRKRDAVALLGTAEGTADELLSQFRRNHDRLDRKEASISVEKFQLYPDMDANALRRLRHRGSDHGSSQTPQPPKGPGQAPPRPVTGSPGAALARPTGLRVTVGPSHH